MGIFDALTNAVSGLQAQSYALENISGNIANSSTIGYKRTETSFKDLFVESASAGTRAQRSGSVFAFSRATNDIAGTISASDTGTSLAVDGDGYLLVQNSNGSNNGVQQFTGQNLYTKRGDFDLDKNGNLVNGAGYYLVGRAVSKTGVASATPTVINVADSDLYPAVATTTVTYKANLPSTPKPEDYVDGNLNSSLLPARTTTGPVATPGTFGSTTPTDLSTDVDLSALAGKTFSINGAPIYTFTGAAAGQKAALEAAIEGANGGGVYTATFSNTGLAISSADGSNFTVGTSDASVNTALGITPGTTTNGIQANVTSGFGSTITGSEETSFLTKTIPGGSTTVYDANGSSKEMEFRWAKRTNADATTTPPTKDTWSLYYKTDSTATGSDPAWVEVDTSTATAGVQGYTFEGGVMTVPTPPKTTISNVVIDGSIFGDIALNHGTGMSQYSDSTGQISTTTIVQDGVSAGELTGLAISDGGSLMATYSNGRTKALYDIPLATFPSDNQLKHLDGGAYSATEDSGSPTLVSGEAIVGSALEASNVDISDEFTKMIVTQQAYSANTRVVSTANDMMQETLSMIR
jgi:flagellar hook protein FlgE